jgi:hypothetical protein
MPLLEDIKGVLSFAAFRPDPDDAETSWAKRFHSRRSLLINVSRTHTSWRSINKRGKFQEAGSQGGELAEVATGRAEEWRALTDGGWVNVSLNHRFIISLENNMSRREGYRSLLQSNPKAVIGTKCDRGKRYAIYHHPHTTSSILMACDDTAVKGAEDSLRAAGLKAGRICCGLFALHEQKLGEIYQTDRPEARASFVLIATCEGSLATLVQQDGQWTDLRCRSGVGMETVDPMIQIVSPLAQKIQAGSTVMLLHDGMHPPFCAEMLKKLQLLGEFDVKDISIEDQLWNTIGQN